MAKKKKSSKAKTKKVNTKATTVAKPSKTPQRIAFASLRRWNIWLAVIFAAEAIAILVLSKTVTLPVVTHFLTKDTLASQAAKYTVFAPAVRHLFDVHIASLVAAFLVVSAAAHGAMATIHRKSYEAGLERRINRIRWIDFGVGASLMMIVIAMLNGIYDASSLLMMTALVAIIHGLAYLSELQNKDSKHVNWLNFWGILAAGATVWLTIDIYAKGAWVYGTHLPNYVYWIDITVFVLLLGVAANIWLVLRQKGKWADYVYGERVYMLLSFLVRTALAWQLYVGLLR